MPQNPSPNPQNPGAQTGKAVAQHDPWSLLSSLESGGQKQVPFQSRPFAKESNSAFLHLSVLHLMKENELPHTCARIKNVADSCAEEFIHRRAFVIALIVVLLLVR